jgi:hypothetical protein
VRHKSSGRPEPQSRRQLRAGRLNPHSGWLLLAALGTLGALLFWRLHGPSGTDYVAPSLEDPGPEAPDDIGVARLLEELADLSSVAQLPDPPYVARMASSYDRRSRSKEDPETWFANDDWASRKRPHFLRIDEVAGRREYVLLDVEGPGALVRLWTATPTGTLRIYVDRQERPVLEAPMLDLLGGSDVIPEPFAHVAARGYSAYFPIPFRAACRVTVDDIVASNPFAPGPLEKFYYQINYRLYAKEAAPRIRSFHPKDLYRAAPALARIARVLEHPAAAYEPTPEHRRVPLVAAGDEARATATRPGGGAIRKLLLRIRDTGEEALRRATLTLLVDGEITVQAPLGDFFGTGPGLTPYQSLPFSVGKDGDCVSRWPMPFRDSAMLVVQQSPGIEGELWVEPWPWTERTLHFHAHWRPEASVATRPLRDLRLLEVAGNGLFVGTLFNLTNPAGAKWWGEGDEKMWVDGEAFPSLFGTGTEDYFGYAWSTPEPFSQAFHAQTRAGTSRFDGAFSLNRFHTLDAVPFAKKFAFDLELWHLGDTRVSWSAMTYYYARPGAKERR